MCPDCSRRGAQSLRSGTGDRPLRLLSVGRLHWKKGHELALAAAAILRERGVELEYRIVGDGEHREPTEFAVTDLGLDGHVQLLGALDADGVREQLAWADALIHPSLTEAFGVAVAEAQAMGLPVVCSDAGGLPENIAHGVTGFAVPRRDVAAMADAAAPTGGRPRSADQDGRSPPVTGRNRNSTTASSSIASRPSTAACWRLPRPT